MAKKSSMGHTRTRKVAVTGNQGYIGSVLTKLLVESGYKVLGIDAGIFEDAQMTPRVPASVQIKKDIRDVEVGDLAGCDGIIHLAGLSNDPLGELDVQLTYDINYKAGVRLAEIAKKAKISRFLFSSSCSTYGASGKKIMQEADPLDPQTAYARSKVMMEAELINMTKGDFTPVILRNATVFGFSPRLRLDLVVNDLTASGYLSHKIEVLSDGTPWRPNLHVIDCAQAFIYLLEIEAGRVRGEAFNVGRADNNLQVKDIAQAVKKEIKGSQVIIKSETAGDTRTYRVNFSKIEQLGYKAGRTVQWGVQELIRNFSQTGFNQGEREFNGYYTLKRYQAMIDAGMLSKELRMTEEVAV